MNKLTFRIAVDLVRGTAAYRLWRTIGLAR